MQPRRQRARPTHPRRGFMETPMMMQDVVSVGSAIHQQINTCVRNYINKCVYIYI